MQHNIPGRTKNEIIQDVASLSARQVYANPHVASNTNLQRDLRGDVARTTTVQFRQQDGTATPVSLEQAYKMQKADNETDSDDEWVKSAPDITYLVLHRDIYTNTGVTICMPDLVNKLYVHYISIGI